VGTGSSLRRAYGRASHQSWPRAQAGDPGLVGFPVVTHAQPPVAPGCQYAKVGRSERPAATPFWGGRDRRRSGDLALFRRALCRLSYPTVGDHVSVQRQRRTPVEPSGAAGRTRPYLPTGQGRQLGRELSWARLVPDRGAPLDGQAARCASPGDWGELELTLQAPSPRRLEGEAGSVPRLKRPCRRPAWMSRLDRRTLKRPDRGASNAAGRLRSRHDLGEHAVPSWPSEASRWFRCLETAPGGPDGI
jgi:hypothetical protein